MYVQVPLVSQNDAHSLALALQSSHGKRSQLNQLELDTATATATATALQQQQNTKKRPIVALSKTPPPTSLSGQSSPTVKR